MDLELLTVGTELLLGFTVDTNAAFAGQALAGAGIRVVRRTTVSDDPALLRDALAEALGRTRLVLTTGGLGPTRDDLTKKVVADLLGLELEFQEELWTALVERFARMGRKISDRNRCQAEVPRGAVVLPNRWGTAPGLWISGELGEVIMLPGVPIEMRGLMTHEVLPRLAPRTGARVVRSRTVRTTGIPESTLADRVSDIEATLDPLTLAYLPGLEGVDLRLTAWDMESTAADGLLQAASERLRVQLGDHAYGGEGDDLAGILLDECRARGKTIVVAESCTGGMIGERITAIPGSSDVFLGGIIAYADRLKSALGVPDRILEEFGAVSEETVKAMAKAVRERHGADLAVSVSGIAGPAGGSPEKPAGTVWFGFAGDFGVAAVRWVFPGTRDEIRARASQFALFGLLRHAKSAGA
ncbi:MAG TPA: competence/damage-inducible protein A [Gemmatimonadales bacterium]|nr:competence/damage-inducible protein A [Gemmatimonadales bacterium]